MSDAVEFGDVVRALLQNALDLVSDGKCTLIDVEVSEDAVRVRDDGPGLPVHPHPFSGRPGIEVILTGPRRGPRNTLATVNAACLWMDAEVHHEGQLYFQRYEFAQPAAPLARRGVATRQGTTLTCAPARGTPPGIAELRALVEELTADLKEVRAKVRIADRREARDETILLG